MKCIHGVHPVHLSAQTRIEGVGGGGRGIEWDGRRGVTRFQSSTLYIYVCSCVARDLL